MPYKKCKRMTVHAMGIDAEGNIEYARNGNPSKCKNIPGGCGCIHAEIRLLKKMHRPLSVSVSHSPCLDCAKALVKAGVKQVTYFKPYRLSDGIDYLIDHDVFVTTHFGCFLLIKDR